MCLDFSPCFDSKCTASFWFNFLDPFGIESSKLDTMISLKKESRSAGDDFCVGNT